MKSKKKKKTLLERGLVYVFDKNYIFVTVF